jgi:hypothetical protein
MVKKIISWNVEVININFYVCYKVKLSRGIQYSKEKNNFHFPKKWVGIKDSNEYSNKIEITIHIFTFTNNSKKHNYG